MAPPGRGALSASAAAASAFPVASRASGEEPRIRAFRYVGGDRHRGRPGAGPQVRGFIGTGAPRPPSFLAY